MPKRQFRVVGNVIVAGILVLLAFWVAGRFLPNRSPPLDPSLSLYANGLVSEDGTLQLYVEKPIEQNNEGNQQYNEKGRKKGQQRNRPVPLRKKKPSKEEIEAYRKELQNRKELRRGKNFGIDMSLLNDDVIDRYISNGEPEEELRKVHPKIRKAFLRKVMQKKGNQT